MCKPPSQMLPVIRIASRRRFQDHDAVVKEATVQMHLNGKAIVRLSCLPSGLNHLAVGYLFAHHLLHSYEQVSSVKAQKTGNHSHCIDIITTDTHAVKKLGRENLQQHTTAVPATRVFGQTCEDTFRVSSAYILSCMRVFEQTSPLFRDTGGTHSCGLYDRHSSLCHVLFEDTGRLNAADKVLGYCLAHHIDATDKMLLVSGRVSADLVRRAVSLQVPVLVSPSAPTNWAVELGEEKGITIVGFVREQRMNIYSHTARVL